MPIYEYSCPRCGTFEVVQKIGEKPLKKKPECQDPNCPRAAEKLISASAFHLKGSGWYKTDYASNGSAGKNGSSSKKDKGADKGSESSDSKPASEKKSDSKSEGDKGKPSKPCGPGCGCH